ncbi:MAG: pectate lyase [Verrucomicrobia bacterium]|nr:pectate lyase [Verrucomicrobiota bacterium]
MLPALSFILLCSATLCGQTEPRTDLRAEMTLLFQNPDGGWPKNVKWDSFKTLQDAKNAHDQNKPRKSTFDNNATYTQIRNLSKSFKVTENRRYRQAAKRGLDFIFREQRHSGGWRGSDVDAITYNDDAMIGVMQLLREVSEGQTHFSWADSQTRRDARRALKRAIRVTLDCQIKVNNRRTGWCQQHDHKSLKPVKARAYELPSISGAESVDIVRFLMEIETPSNEVIEAIEGAVAWFQQSAIKNVRIETYPIEPVKDGQKIISSDKRVVSEPDAERIWARFYEIGTNRPFFCNRDGIKVYSLDQVKLERRTGYSWYGSYADSLLVRDYPQWKKRLNR